MILNLSSETGEVLLGLVDSGADRLLKLIPKLKGDRQREAIGLLQHLGIAKHRLEYNLGKEEVFVGPAAWGYPRKGTRSVTAVWPFGTGS